jgi:hypothetical protein
MSCFLTPEINQTIKIQLVSFQKFLMLGICTLNRVSFARRVRALWRKLLKLEETASKKILTFFGTLLDIGEVSDITPLRRGEAWKL